ncbi:hypothetical protein EYF80_001746 [Liparis tanakae]|uniref:Uncharacterized protein n=1 Tax=Liparis tanakae TaxID=230148 RepID=A0A4Z2JCZ0_9TELE|nr:hypothetical protein EYF80_001746 [Liparis tanakae]
MLLNTFSSSVDMTIWPFKALRRFTKLTRTTGLTQRSKVPPLLYESVEEGETKQELLPNDLLLGAAKEGRVRDGVTQIRSRAGIQLVARWQFCSTTQVPSLMAFSII